MFETISRREGSRPVRRFATVAASAVAHGVVLVVVVALPLLYMTDTLPSPPDMLTFVVPAAAPPPPPPPPTAPSPQPVRTAPRKSTPAPQPAPLVAQEPAPVELPGEIRPEIDLPLPSGGSPSARAPGTFAGVPGGVLGGFAGGTVGGLGHQPAPAAPPPPIRVGGQIAPPTLTKKVEPEYPPLAVAANVEGTVILEATVNKRGHVAGVEVLRSHPLLATAAIDAVKQWQYEPLMLNGSPQPFVLTVTVSFNLG
jgi:protein TonB